jgi:hypothetical protein
VGAQELTDDELAASLAGLIREYASRAECKPPGAMRTAARWEDKLNATETVRIAVDLLRAADITSFELAAMFNI